MSPSDMEPPALDIEETLARLMVPAEVLKPLFGDFRAKYADAADTIGTMLADGSREEAEREAHSLKGVSGSLGAAGVHELAGAVEQAIKDGRDDEARADLARLDAAMGQAVAEIDKFLG